VITWWHHARGLWREFTLDGAIFAGCDTGALVLDQVATRIVNPDNAEPDVKEGKWATLCRPLVMRCSSSVVLFLMLS
jgi:hypothetical protein